MLHVSNDPRPDAAPQGVGRARSLAMHPAGSARRDRPAIVTPPDDADGSLVTEYGLLAVVAATVAGVVISWASNGALVSLFNALLRQARTLVGA